MEVPILLVGLGPMGRIIGELACEKSWLKVVGAVDSDPRLIGTPLEQLIPLRHSPGMKVAATPEEALRSAGRESSSSEKPRPAAVAATTSRLVDTAPLLERLFDLGLSVVSTCEELTFPLPSTESLWNALNRRAVKQGVAAAGTGINPGFLMDLLPLLLSAPCARIDRLSMERRINTSRRRGSFQEKVGVGLNRELFEQGVKEGRIGGHVGLEVSLRAVAAGLAWPLEGVEKIPLTPFYTPARAGNSLAHSQDTVTGITQEILGFSGENREIRLAFSAIAGEPDEADVILIEGDPPVRQIIRPGIQGDRGTAAMILHTLPGLLKSPPGLHTVLDLPLPRFR